MKLKDYYKILGVERTASSSEIKAMYKKMALIYHPDRNPNSQILAMKFSEITEAYNVLGDLEKRLKYSVLLNKDKKFMNKLKLQDYSIRKGNPIFE